MDCLFKANLKKVKIPFLSKLPFHQLSGTPYVYFAHSVVSDIAKQKNYKEIQYVSMSSNDSFSRPLMYVNYIDPIIAHGYVNCEIVEISPFNYHLKTKNLDLQLQARKKPLLEGGKGFVSVCGRESYYYSLTDLTAHGTIIIDSKKIAVEGKAWMDHQWADAPYRKDKWTWFCIQLNDGTDIMCVEYNSGKSKDYLVDIIDARGRQYHSRRVLLEPGNKIWQSKKTKAKYPLEWFISIPGKKMFFNVRSIIGDQEMIYGAITYWEGPTKVSGTINGKKVTGVGFMELVGYPTDYNFPMLAGREINNAVLKKIKKSGSYISNKFFDRFQKNSQ
jgi:predicted secreted hydrolase